MMGRKMLVVLLVLGVFAIAAVHPPRAHAGLDLEQSLIIAGASVGALAIITFIAILGSSDDDEPEFLTQAPRRRDEEQRIHSGFQGLHACPPVGGNVSLLCW